MLENIKSRANIAIDPSKGRNMLGVVDETGKLLYGQVFVQYTTDISYGETMKETTILTGKCLLVVYICFQTLLFVFCNLCVTFMKIR